MRKFLRRCWKLVAWLDQLWKKFLGASTRSEVSRLESSDKQAESTRVLPAQVAVELLAQGLGRHSLQGASSAVGEAVKQSVPAPSCQQSNKPLLEQAEQLARQLELEAQGCLWRLQGGQDRQQRKKLEAQGKKFRRYIWAFHRKWSHDSAPWELLARWYAAAAQSVRLCVIALRVGPPASERFAVVQLLAQCQSALLQIAQQYWGRDDRQQKEMYSLIRQLLQHWKIDRWVSYLSRKEPVDLHSLEEVETQLRSLQQCLERLKHQQNLLNKLRYESTQRFPQGGEQAQRAVRTILATIEQLSQLGCPMSHSEIIQALLAIRAKLPPQEELSGAVRQALRCADQSAQCSKSLPHSPLPDFPEHTQKLRYVLEGKKVVLVAGEVRPLAQKKIVEAFGLKELVWCEARDGESVRKLESLIASPDVFLVLVAPRWASHGHTEALSQYCRKHHKPLVRLRSGYNPNAIAYQLLQQCSHQLGL